MITIGIVSDTHIPIRARSLPVALLQKLQGVDMILHAGDLEIIDVIHELEMIAQTTAVRGNMDPSFLQGELEVKRVLRVGKFKIGLTHGRGAPEGLEDRIRHDFPNDIDCIVYGHSHRAVINKKDGILFVNPGSPTDTVFAPFQSFALLKVEDDCLSSEIVRL